MLCYSTDCFAQGSTRVDEATARKVAATFLKGCGVDVSASSLVDISATTPFRELYVFSIDGGGFIVVAGDSHTHPVLAFSTESNFSASNMPPHVHKWFESYERGIAANRGASVPLSVESEWDRLAHGIAPDNTKATIGPFISTKWNQSPYYNQYCPFDSTANDFAVAGCTAIATAQIMKFYNHPSKGYGNCTYTHNLFGPLSANYEVNYLWDSMPEKLEATSTTTQVDAVATIVYHSGVAVSMDYSVHGSGGKTASYGYGGEPSSENAFKYNFKYSPYIWTAFRIDYTIDEWKQLMLNEIENGRPVLYAGYDEVQSGHAFVLDGYNSNSGRFHFNWGWGGTYDGYYILSNLNPNSLANGNSGYHFDLFATATLGIEPYDLFNPHGSTTVTTHTQGSGSASADDGVVTGAGTYSFGDTITLTATATNEWTRFLQWSDGCRYNPRSTVATGGDLEFTAVFAPVMNDTLRYHTCDNAMNRASNLPDGIGTDTVWGIKIPAAAIKPGSQLNAVRFMGRKLTHYTLTIMSGETTPDNELFSHYFFGNLDYNYTFFTYNLPSPISLDGSQSLWIVLKCTELDTPGVFSIYGGNPNSMLSGADLSPMADSWKFSWMIEGIFQGNVGIGNSQLSSTPVSIFPNPANSQITLEGANGVDEVVIVDINGTSRRTSVTNGFVDVSFLSPGVYLLRIDSHGIRTTKRFVICR